MRQGTDQGRTSQERIRCSMIESFEFLAKSKPFLLQQTFQFVGQLLQSPLLSVEYYQSFLTVALYLALLFLGKEQPQSPRDWHVISRECNRLRGDDLSNDCLKIFKGLSLHKTLLLSKFHRRILQIYIFFIYFMRSPPESDELAGGARALWFWS